MCDLVSVPLILQSHSMQMERNKLNSNRMRKEFDISDAWGAQKCSDRIQEGRIGRVGVSRLRFTMPLPDSGNVINNYARNSIRNSDISSPLKDDFICQMFLKKLELCSCREDGKGQR